MDSEPECEMAMVFFFFSSFCAVVSCCTSPFLFMKEVLGSDRSSRRAAGSCSARVGLVGGASRGVESVVEVTVAAKRLAVR